MSVHRFCILMICALGLASCQTEVAQVLSPNQVSSNNKTPNPTVAPSITTEIKIKAKAFLHGAYDISNPLLMRDTLRSSNYLPLSQPYSAISRFSYHKGTEQVKPAVLAITGELAVVDWILLELRNSASRKTFSRAALLLRNGSIVDVDGVSAVSFKDVPEENYYIIVKHRNHLGHMSDSDHHLKDQDVFTFDFSLPETQVFGFIEIIMTSETASLRTLPSGDANQDGIVDAFNGSAYVGTDKYIITTDISMGAMGYLSSDVNLSSAPNATDLNLVTTNVFLATGLSSITISEQIPKIPL